MPRTLPQWIRELTECTAEHVVRLERIKRLHADEHTRLEIGRILMEPPTAWWRRWRPLRGRRSNREQRLHRASAAR